MRKSILCVLCLGLTLTACGASSGSAVPPAGPAAVPSPTPPAASGPLTWQMTVAQNGAEVPAQNYEVALAKAPFTLRFTMTTPTPVKLNAWLDDQNFQALNPGFQFTEDCALALCTGMNVAEPSFGETRNLLISAEDTHYWHYTSADEHRWNTVAFTPSGAQFERDIAYLDDQPIAQFPGQALYLLIFVNLQNPSVIDEGELQKVVLVFQ